MGDHLGTAETFGDVFAGTHRLSRWASDARVVRRAGVPDRAIGELDLRGVSLVAHNEGRPLADDRTLRVFARVAELGVPLFLQPGLRSTTRACTRGTREELGLAWMYQTALAALQLVDGGVLDAVPDLVVVHPHLGGALP